MSWPKDDRARAERAWFHERTFTLKHNLGGSTISGHRSPERNVKVGGNPHSLHLIDLGEDILFPSRGKKEAAMVMAKDLGLHWNDSKPGSLVLHLQARAPKRQL